MLCARINDVRRRTVALATACAMLTTLLVSTLSLSGDQTPLVLSGSVLVAYFVHLVGVLEERAALFHLGLYGAAYTHGMQFMYYYTTTTWWEVPSMAALVLAGCCCAYTGCTVGMMARAEKVSDTVQPARRYGEEDESKTDYV